MTYPSLRARIKVEWKSYLVAALFTVIAEYIGTVKLKVGPGMIILFPVFYAIILGMLSGPQVMRWFDNRHVKAASKLVIVGNYCRRKYGHDLTCWSGIAGARLR